MGFTQVLINLGKFCMTNGPRVIEFAIKHKRDIAFVFMLVARVAPKAYNWWNGKKIAVLGVPAVGKDSLFLKLKGASISEQHGQTKGLEKVKQFKINTIIP